MQYNYDKFQTNFDMNKKQIVMHLVLRMDE